ncbi:competence type IV pilus minor pilin ComGF [Bacillus fonticola]|uniref:competence type IV pilus minor pilin ComGF n=1 Tax=Bacillus fonticola TaxID=2728853 RepID=UPI001474736D|nr:competence type IV pilus minor pilin ComGF [Bacillus fonticola]
MVRTTESSACHDEQGFTLAEVLVTILLLSLLTLLFTPLTQLMTRGTEITSIQQSYSRQQLVLQKIATEVQQSEEVACLEKGIRSQQGNDMIRYEQKGSFVMRTVNGAGYEPVARDVNTFMCQGDGLVEITIQTTNNPMQSLWVRSWKQEERLW